MGLSPSLFIRNHSIVLRTETFIGEESNISLERECVPGTSANDFVSPPYFSFGIVST